MPDESKFNISTGVPQGFSVSPVLFNAYLHHILSKSELLGHHIMAFADDITLVANSVEEMDEIIDKIQKSLSTFTPINYEKSAILPSNTKHMPVTDHLGYKGFPVK